MPPRKAAAASAEGEPRRSSRIKDLPKPAAPAKKAAKPRAKKVEGEAAKGKKRTADDKAADGDTPDATEEPQAKKAKPASKAAKPASKAEGKAGSKPPSAVKANNSDDKENEGAGPIATIPEEPEEEKTSDAKALEIGDALPSLELKNEKDEAINVASLAKEHGVVFFLFPKADTPGCTKQACAFRDSHDDFKAKGYVVYGLSSDAGAAQTKWQTKHNIPYSFLSDPKRELIKALGALNGKSTKRSHFIFEKGGKLVDKKLGVKPEESHSEALEFIKKHST